MSAARRVAVLGDVHGNAPALAAVLDEVRREDVDLVVWTGDLSWGPEPTATLDLVRSLELPSRFVRGNSERYLLELADGAVEEPPERERWMLAAHTADDLALLRTYEHAHSIEVDGLGAVYFTHGSPRSDEELLTAVTPEPRLRDATREISERVLVSGHTHAQYDRVAGLRALNPGSVGLPYEGRPGAYWALLGPDVELRRTEYDVRDAVARLRASGIPDPERLVETLEHPPTPQEMQSQAERLEFSG
jgi:putative phosphoesterase